MGFAKKTDTLMTRSEGLTDAHSSLKTFMRTNVLDSLNETEDLGGLRQTRGFSP
jgi:hypothetical protein